MKTFLNSLRVSLVMILLLGFVYVYATTGVGQLLFPSQSNGSLIEYNGTVIGSELLGQDFKDPKYFHGRISAYNYNTYTKDDSNTKDSNAENTSATGNETAAYAGVGSGSANLAVSNPELLKRVNADIEAFVKNNPNVGNVDIPTDLLTSSGSGLDPHLSTDSANVQIARISEETGLDKSVINKIVEKCTEGRDLGIFGEPRVNILKANIEIENLLKNQ